MIGRYHSAHCVVSEGLIQTAHKRSPWGKMEGTKSSMSIDNRINNKIRIQKVIVIFIEYREEDSKPQGEDLGRDGMVLGTSNHNNSNNYLMRDSLDFSTLLIR